MKRELNNDIKDFIRTGYMLVNEPETLHVSLMEAYKCWERFFASSYKFSQVSSLSDFTSNGYIPLIVPKGCSMNESYYHNWGMRFPAGVKEATMKIIVGLTEVAEQVSKSLELIFGQKLVERPDRSCLKITRYPAFKGEKDSFRIKELANSGMLRSPTHTDINSLTILPFATAVGLEILEQNSNWKLMDIEQDAILVISGRELEARSNKKISATIHRVRNPLENEQHLARLSMAFFVS